MRDIVCASIVVSVSFDGLVAFGVIVGRLRVNLDDVVAAADEDVGAVEGTAEEDDRLEEFRWSGHRKWSSFCLRVRS